MPERKTPSDPQQRDVRVMSPEEAFALARKQQARGRQAEAEALYRKILHYVPDHAGSLHHLGLMRFQQGHGQEALDMVRRSAALAPQKALYHKNLGVMFQKAGMLYEAEAADRRALDLAPEDPVSHYNLGLVLQLQDRLEEAEAAYRRAVELKADYAEAQNNLASVLHKQEKLAPAEAAIRRALELTPNEPDLHHNLGWVLNGQDRLEAAEASFRRGLEISPENAEAHYGLGCVLQRQEQREAAEAEYRRAIDLKPDHYKAYHFLSEVHAFSDNDPLIAALKSLLARYDLREPGQDRDVVLGALARAHEKLGRHAEAFAYYRESNDGRWNGATFDADAERETVRAIKRIFADRAPAVAEAGDLPWEPIFVVGVSRSGKTLVESLLSQHPEVHAAGESHAWSDAVTQALKRHGIIKGYPDCVVSLDAPRIAEIGAAYRAALADSVGDATRVVNTMPGNHVYIGLILRALPSARIVFAHRDPLDNGLMVYFKRYKTGHEYSYDQTALGAYCQCYRDIMAHWRELYPEQILSVRYENLVRDPLREAGRIYAHCGLALDPAALDVSAVHADEIGCARPYAPFLGPLREALGLPAA